MVFFTCSHCGDSIKKPSVTKHYQTKCRNQTPFLTCVDCLKDFKGDEYDAHTKCVTEDERYSAKGYVPKPSANKGERKQKAWSECIEGLLSTSDLREDERGILKVIVKFDNIPRKKAKFINFLKSSAKVYVNNKAELIDRLWEKLENYFKEANQSIDNQQNSTETNGDKGQITECGDEKKQKMNSENLNTENDNGNCQVDDKQKKKKKKQQNGEVEKNNIGSENGNIENVEKESKKKRKLKAEEVPEVENNNVTNEDGNMEKVEKESKKKKKLKAEEVTEVENNNVTNGDGNVEKVEKESKKKRKLKAEEVTEAGGEPEKKKSKSKKENAIENGVEMEIEMNDKENVREKKKKRKNVENGETPAVGDTQVEDVKEQVAFDWSDAIQSVLSSKTDDNKMSLKKLQKKVLKKYCKAFGCEADEKTVKKFSKKLNKIQGVTIDGDYVCLAK